MKTVNRRRLVLDPSMLYYLRGALIMQERRNITWNEFAKIVDISPDYFKDLRTGKSNAGTVSVRKILKLRERGIMIHFEDLMVDPELLGR
jgi:hypothetical protein